MFSIITTHSLDEHADSLAAYYPGGELFSAKFIADSNLRRLLRGLSQEYVRCEEYVKALQDEFIPDKTVLFLDEWERVLGIPDSCFNGLGTNDKRRRDVLVKLASLGVQTVEDFERLALIFGVVVTVIPGTDYDDFPFPITVEEKRWYMVVEFNSVDDGFTYTFPFLFGTNEFGILECLYRNLKPAHCEVLFQQKPLFLTLTGPDPMIDYGSLELTGVPGSLGIMG